MKTDMKNNPVIAGILVCVLIGLVIYTFRQSGGEDAPAGSRDAATSSQADTGKADTTPKADSEKSMDAVNGDRSIGFLANTSPLLGQSGTASGHDPFFHPALRVLAASTGTAPGGAEEILGPETVIEKPGPSLSPVSVRMEPLQTREIDHPASDNRSLQALQPVPSTTPALQAAARGNEPTQERLRLTAILTSDSGFGARAVIEGVGSHPRTVRKGDTLGDYRIAAIHRREIVLAGRNGLTTLPLSTQPSEPSSAPVPGIPHDKKAVIQELEGE